MCMTVACMCRIGMLGWHSSGQYEQERCSEGMTVASMCRTGELEGMTMGIFCTTKVLKGITVAHGGFTVPLHCTGTYLLCIIMYFAIHMCDTCTRVCVHFFTHDGGLAFSGLP